MPVIDSDAHVIETTETWKYIREEEHALTPLSVTRDWGPVSYTHLTLPTKA